MYPSRHLTLDAHAANCRPCVSSVDLSQPPRSVSLGASRGSRRMRRASPVVPCLPRSPIPTTSASSVRSCRVWGARAGRSISSSRLTAPRACATMAASQPVSRSPPHARVTEIVQSDDRHRAVDLLYASLPTERLRTAPPSSPRVNGVAEGLLTVRVPFEQQDLVAGRESFACHRTQYTASEMESINNTLAHVWNGVVYLRPWNGMVRDPSAVLRP